MSSPRDAHDPAEAFKRLLAPIIPGLYRQAFRWTAARDRAEDLVQELLVRLYPRMNEVASLERVQPWATKVMYRIFVDQYRRERHSPVQSLEALTARQDPLEPLPEASADEDLEPPAQVELALTRERLAAAWARLGEDHRVVVALHDIEGYSLEEISGLLDTPVGTVKSRLHRARIHLRQLLAREPFAPAVRDQDRRGAK